MNAASPSQKIVPLSHVLCLFFIRPCYQINTLNQFHIIFQELIDKYRAPSSICGMTVIAAAHVLHDHLSSPQSKSLPSWSQRIEALEMALKDLDTVRPYVIKAMAFIHESRLAYITSHEADFPTAADRDKYMKGKGTAIDHNEEAGRS